MGDTAMMQVYAPQGASKCTRHDVKELNFYFVGLFKEFGASWTAKMVNVSLKKIGQPIAQKSWPRFLAGCSHNKSTSRIQNERTAASGGAGWRASRW